MNRTKKPLLVIAALATGTAAFLARAQAQVSVFTSRPAWEAATAGSPGVFFEDFEGFAVDTPFRTATVDVGPFTLRQAGSGALRNFIDVPAFEFPDNNGTKHASLFTNSGGTTVDMTFAAPLLGWGADFFGTATGELLDLDLVLETGEVLAAVPVSLDTGFFGFVTSPAHTIGRVAFRSRTDIPGPIGEGFGLDNVAGALIPEPGSLTLLGAGALALVSYGWRRRGRPEVPD